MAEEKKVPEIEKALPENNADEKETEVGKAEVVNPDSAEKSTEEAASDKALAVSEAGKAEEGSISDKLWEAAGNISRASADVKARLADQEKSRERAEDEEKARLEEAEKKRLEDERVAKLVAEQKLAALEYAENYRKKLQREKAKNMSAAKQREKEEREREAAKAREEKAKEIAEMLERERAEARARSERAEQLLERVSRATAEEEKPVEETVAEPVAQAVEEPAVEQAAEADETEAKAVEPEEDGSMVISIEEESEEDGVSVDDDGSLVIDTAPVYDYSAWEREMELYRKQVEEANRRHAELLEEARKRAGEEREEKLRAIAEEEKRFKEELAVLKAHRDELADTYERRKAALESEVEKYGEKVRAMETKAEAVRSSAEAQKPEPAVIAPEIVEETVAPAPAAEKKVEEKVEASEPEITVTEEQPDIIVVAAPVEKEEELPAEIKLPPEKPAEPEEIVAIMPEVSEEPIPEEIKPEIQPEAEAEEPALESVPEETAEEKVEEKSEETVEEPAPKEKKKKEEPEYDKKDLYAAAKFEGKRVGDEKQYAKYEKLVESAVKKLEKELLKQSAKAGASEAAEAAALTVQCIIIAAKIAELRCDGLAIAVKFAGKKRIAKLKKLLGEAISDYNELAVKYASLTGEQLSRLSAFLPDYIATETGVAVIPELTYRERYAEVAESGAEARDGAISLDAESKNILATTKVLATPYTDSELLANLTVADKKGVAKYAKQAKKAYSTLDKYIAKLEKKRSAKKLSDQDRQHLFMETVVAKQQKLFIAISVLEKCCEFGQKKLVGEAKTVALDIMLAYNLALDEYAKLYECAIPRAISAICDEIVAGRPYRKISKIAYRRELIERVGENVRIIGYSKKTEAVATDAEDVTVTIPEIAEVDAKIDVVEQKKRVVEVKDEKAEKKAADKAVSEAALAAVASRELAKYLKKRVRERKPTVAELDKTVKAKKAADGSQRAEYVIKCLGLEKLIIDSLAADATACVQAPDKKLADKLCKELDGEIKSYNKLVKEYAKLTGEKLTEAPTEMSRCILEGKPYPAIPAVIYKKAETAYDHEEINRVDRAELAKYIDKGEREINDVRKELAGHIKARDGEKGNKRVVHIIAAIGCEKRIIEKLCDHLLAACHVKEQKTVDRQKKLLSNEISAYNKLVDECNKLSGNKLTRASVSIPEDIVAGRSYTGIPTVSCSVSGGDTAKTADGAKSDKKAENIADKDARAVEREAEKQARVDEKAARRAEKEAREVERQDRADEKAARKAEKDAKKSEKDAKESKKDAAKAEKEAAKSEKEVKKSEKEAKKAEKAAKKAKKKEKKAAKEAKKAKKKEAREAKQAEANAKLEKEAEKFAEKQAKKDKRKAEKAAKAEKNKKKDKLTAESVAVDTEEDRKLAVARAARGAKFKDQSEKALAVLTDEAEFRISMLESDHDVVRYRFSADKSNEKKRSGQIKREIKAIQKRHKEALKYEALDNERYYAVASLDIEHTSFKRSKANKAKLEEMRTQLIKLLDERAALNAQLSTQYTGTEINVGGISTNQDLRSQKTRAEAKEYKKLLEDGRRIAKLNMSPQDKQKLYDLLNNKISANANTAMCKWRLKHEKNSKADKKQLNKEISKNKQTVDEIDRKLRLARKQLHIKTKNSGGVGGTVMTVFGLLLLCVVGFAIYALMPESGELGESVRAFVSQFIPPELKP